MTIFGREPSFWIGVIVSSILAVLSVLTGQGVVGDALAGQITDGVNAIAQLLVLLAPVLTSLLIRSQVTPVASPQLPAGIILTVVAPGDRPNQRVTL
jgi:uncharacterized membrane protein